MDAGDFIYIIIAIVLAILNAVANSNKKKKAQEKKPQTATEPVEENTLEQKLRGLLGEEPDQLPNVASYKMGDEASQHSYANETAQESETQSSHSSGEAVLDEAEFTIDKPLSEEELYPLQQAQVIDAATISEAYTDIPISKVEGPIGDYDFQESLNETLLDVEKKDLPDEELSKTETQPKASLLDDFDPLKAIVYSEIIRPKYF